MPHHHHHSHRAGGSSIVGALFIGSCVGGWYLGLALGLTGVLACVTGTAIIFGGLMALAAVSVGIFALVQSCRNRAHARAARVVQEPAPALGNTQHITWRLNASAPPGDQSVYAQPPAPPVTHPPLFQRPSAPSAEAVSEQRYDDYEPAKYGT